MKELAWRKDYLKYTTILAAVGCLIYGLMAIIMGEKLCEIWNISNQILTVILAIALGGYFFFLLASGVMFTVHFVKKCSSGTKIFLAICFPIVIWMALGGVIYSIPYAIYNYWKIRKY